MNSFRSIKSNLLLGLILSIILTAIVIPFIKMGGKYQLKITKDIRIDPNKLFIYKDIDHDGNSEKITVIKDFGGFSALMFQKNEFMKFEWNLHGKIVNENFYCTGDINNDDSDDLFVFTYSHDSIFVNGYDVKKRETLWPPIFISKLKYIHGNVDVSVRDPQIVKLRKKGRKKLVFILYSGFSKSRRAVYILNLQNKSFIVSPKAATCPSMHLYFSDINGNGEDDIFGEIESFGNFSMNYPVTDSLLWFFAYDSHLHYLFKPRILGAYPGKVWIYPLKGVNKNLIAYCVQHNQPKDSSYIAIANDKGELLRYKNLNCEKENIHYYFKVNPPGKRNRLVLYNDETGVVEYFDENLNRTGTYQSVPLYDHVYKFDLDGDGKKEEVYFGKDMEHLVVSRNDFKDPVVLKFNGEVSLSHFSEKWKNGKPEALCLNLKNKYFEFQYNKNPYYTCRYLIYLAIFLLLLFLVNLIGYYYQRLLKLRYRDEEKMRSLQLQAIEQQLNPHFTLNILNSIGALYENRKAELARDYMGKYSKLLRENLLASGEITTSFRQEMDFVETYLELEHFRYINKFTYSISCEVIDIPVQLPRLLIYTFVENALKHGLFHIMGIQPAQLNIQCSDQEKYWKIEISDNGIGRKEAAKIKSFSTGKGLEIMQETLKLFQRLQHRKVTFSVEDLNPEQGYTGTKVTILIQKKADAK